MNLRRSLLLLLFFLLLGGGLWLQLPADGAMQKRYGDMPRVLSMPPETRQPLPSYKGPHPREWTRPQDPFPYPIAPGQVGPHQPLYASSLRYPFACDGEASGLGQPLVDNQQGYGIAVYADDKDTENAGKLIGYSKDCLYPTRVAYYYNRAGSEDFYPLAEADNDIAQLKLNGETIDFIVRVETGTINRFLYSITMLSGPTDQPLAPDLRYWNGDLIYQFKGGVGIGFRQGRMRPTDMAERRFDLLSRGFAIASSTGNHTSNHYNIWLAEESALRVKRQFIARYGQPRFTLGIGGSGGAIQQYLIGQNGSDLLDAGVALYAYPDMLTQTIYALDCELLEYYFDLQAESTWPWSKRQLVSGLNSRAGVRDERGWMYELAMLVHGRLPRWPLGSSECSRSWRGLTPLVNNPRFIHFAPRFASALQGQVHWSYWEHLRHIFGTRADGYAAQTWDNQGVQYGLRALRRGELSPRAFLDLNAKVGGWKPPTQLKPERYWKLNGGALGDFSPWSHHNMLRTPDDGRTPAQRSIADPEAIAAAHRAGLVFTGELGIPLIDLRHYLEPELDMHHLSAAFSTRLRLQDAGRAEQQLIWVTQKPHAPIPEAIALLQQWLSQGQRPAQAQDSCYHADGSLIASGPDVWNGEWNQHPTGTCLKQYPAFGTSRVAAGEDLRGNLFKCPLIAVEQALARGDYTPIDMRPHLARLRQVFPDGVCDYRPAQLVQRP